MAQNPRVMATRFGLRVDGMSTSQATDELFKLLATLELDVSADQTITDGHPRFYQHLTLMSEIGEISFAWQERIDGAKTDAQVNAVARDGIRTIRAM